MSIALSEFWKNLVHAGVVDAEGCKRIAAQYSQAKRGRVVSDPVSLAKFLIKIGSLTEFQARSLLTTPPRTIRFGSFLQLADSSPPPLSRWLPAKSLADQTVGWLLRLPAHRVDTTLLPWLAARQRVTGEGLQPIHCTESTPEVIDVFSPLPSGQCLFNQLEQGQSLDRRQSIEIGIQIARALARLHDQGLVQGTLRTDRVWIAADGQPILLCDPRGAVASLKADDDTPLQLDDLEETTAYQAPELTFPGAGCDPLTDIFSAGSVLFRMITGRQPFAAGASQTSASDMPPELSTAVAQGASGDPCFRVLAFAMARNRSARIATAQQLETALQAVAKLLSPPELPSESLKTIQNQPVIPVAPPATKPARPIPLPSAPPKQSTPREQKAGPPIEAPAPTPQASTPAAVGSRTGRRRKKKSLAPLVLGGLAIVALLLVVAVLVYQPTQPAPPTVTRRSPPADIPKVGGGNLLPDSQLSAPEPTVETVKDGRYALIDDQRLLFVPPASHVADPVPLDLLPPGPAVIVSARMATWQQSSSGQRVLNSLGPDVQGLWNAAVVRTGFAPAEIQRCTAALHPGHEGWPEVSLAIELTQPVALESLLERWQVSASRTPEGTTVYASEEPDRDAFFWAGGQGGKPAPEAQVKRFAVASLERIRQVAQIDGGFIPLPRAMETLWRSSSTGADLFVLVTPNFLFADGRQMLERAAPELVDPLKRFLIPDVTSAQVSVTIDQDDVYLELRMIPSGTLSDAALRERLRQSIQAWPRWADDFVVEVVPDTSWRLLANRLPAMMRFLGSHSRDGLAEAAVVANAYLPATGAAQLSLAVLLAMNTPAGSVASPAGSAEAAPPLTIAQMLDRKMTVSFEQESLDFAVNLIVEQFQGSLPAGSRLPPIRIMGSDLQMMGITQNQQVRDFNKSDLPLRQVLTDLVLGANPDRTATGPADPKQTLLWVVVEPSDTSGPAEILITTRAAAEGKYEIPREFATP